MSFRWPLALLGLSVLPLFAWGYWTALRRRSPRAMLHPDVTTLARAASRSAKWREHRGAALFGAALTVAMFAVARPVMRLPAPAGNIYVMLAIDVSRSMLAQDIPPNRLEAAKRAAVEFVRVMPSHIRVGLVSFSSEATLLVPPTTDHERVVQAIEGLVAEFATAIGEGLLEAVYALPGRSRPQGLARTPPPRSKLPPATVVLMSDGQNNRGISPLDAARVARDLGVKVYTVGIGTREGRLLDIDSQPVWVALDEDTLREMAAITGGAYFHVSSALDLYRTYRVLGRAVGWEWKPTEVSGALAGIAAILLAASVALSVVRIYPFPQAL